MDEIKLKEFTDPQRAKMEKPLDPSLKSWLSSTNKHVKRMSQDEAYRKEVAKDLS